MTDLEKSVRTQAPEGAAAVTPPTREEQIMEKIMSRVRGVDLDQLSQEEAVALGTEVTSQLRLVRGARFRSEDLDLLAQLMSRLLGKGR